MDAICVKIDTVRTENHMFQNDKYENLMEMTKPYLNCFVGQKQKLKLDNCDGKQSLDVTTTS